MPIQILMPALSPTMKEGKLIKWCKKEGDEIVSGDVIAEVETDKATMEIEAVDEGKLAKILIQEGQSNVAVNTPIAIILEDGEAEDAITLSITKLPEVALPEISSSNITLEPMSHHIADITNGNGKRIIASPLAKKIALNQNVSLGNIQGTGPRGRIVKNDVLRTIESDYILDTTNKNEASEIVEVSTMRKVIAQRLTESKQNIPHFYLKIDCQLDKLLELRKQINENLEEKITINDFIIKASALAVKKVPEVNTSWQMNHILKNKNIDISVAVSIDDGLITPIIKNADEKNLAFISKEMKVLIKRAKENNLKPEEFQGGGLTISNMGMYGIKEFFAIINPPQSAILAIGSGEKRPIIIDNQIAIKTIMTITLSCDHRVVDGAIGANFLNEIKNYLENPLTILI